MDPIDFNRLINVKQNDNKYQMVQMQRSGFI